MISIDDGPWMKYGKTCPDDFLLVMPEETEVKIKIKKFNKLLTSVLSFSAFDTNRAIDFNIDDPREFREEDEVDDKPIEIKED